MNEDSFIYVAGHKGMVGSAICRKLEEDGYKNIITRSHEELELLNQKDVEDFFKKEKPEYVFLAAAKVGGIMANDKYSADFLYENILMEMNIINNAFKCGCKKVEFLGSSCIYPKMASQPIKEESLLTGPLEETNEGYAIAKIAGLKYIELLNKQYKTKYISIMPCNLYGINDNYHPENSHVIPGLIHKFHTAKINNEKSVTCWGDGTPLREFLYVDDLADLCVFLMNNYEDSETINAGSGKEVTIKDLAEKISKTVGYKGEINWDVSKPNGTPRKVLDVSKTKEMGWHYKTELDEGLKKAYEDYLERCAGGDLG